MRAPVRGSAAGASATERQLTLVWIDSRDAFVVRSGDRAQEVETLTSEVPAHHRSTGHVRHDPGVRHGGGGPPQTAGEPHRLEHLARFLDAVAERIAAEDDVLVIGPGTVRTRLARRLREEDERRPSGRAVHTEASARLTSRQLVARLRASVAARASSADRPSAR